MMKVGIIGGTGFESPGFLGKVKKVSAETPFGKPSSPMYTASFDGVGVVFLARHGEKQTIPSTRVNYRANLHALQEQKCAFIIATSTCGSLQEEICPGEMIVLDQFIDLTRQRYDSVVEETGPDGIKYAHMAEPFSEDLRDHLIEGAIVSGFTVHTKGTVINIQGPRFSTRAESNLYRSWKADVINMTTTPEVIMANELSIPYASIAICTGYDSWRTGTRAPTPSEITEIIKRNTGHLVKVIMHALMKLKPE